MWESSQQLWKNIGRSIGKEGFKESMDKRTSDCDITVIIFKTTINTIQSINIYRQVSNRQFKVERKGWVRRFLGEKSRDLFEWIPWVLLHVNRENTDIVFQCIKNI